MMFIFLLLTLLMSFTFTRLVYPLSMGFLLLLQTVVVCMMSGLSAYSFWFSYILFLIFLGEMLILFIYVASLASNESFSFPFISFLSFFFYSSYFFSPFTFLSPFIPSDAFSGCPLFCNPFTFLNPPT